MRANFSVNKQLFSIAAAVVLFATSFDNRNANAAIRTYVIDSSQSSLTASGHLYGEPYQAQGAGSLTTNITGNLVVDVIPGSMGSGTVQFLGSSLIDANISGNWQPEPGEFDGLQPADYGAFTDDSSNGVPLKYYLATRDLVAQITSGSIQVSPGNFDVGGISFRLTGGITDWSLYAGGGEYLKGSQALTSTVVSNASTQGSFGPLSVTLPINVSIPVDGDQDNDIDSLFTLTGQLVAMLDNPSQYGDYDGDGDVDGADFVMWQDNFPSLGGFTGGDGDGDGDVDGADFVVWQTNFPFATVSSQAGGSLVPEPASICSMLAAIVGVGFFGARRYASRAIARGR